MIKQETSELREFLNVGIIQPIILPHIAWDNPPSIRMKNQIEEKIWQDLCKGFNHLLNETSKPNLIVIPELSVPLRYLRNFKKLCSTLGAVVIAGLDFKTNNLNVTNQGIISIPIGWPDDVSKASSIIHFGKIFFSKEEEKLFNDLTPIHHAKPFQTTYIYDAGPYGKIGLAICSDIFDIERWVIFKGRIHHFVIVAFNQDTRSFYHLAESISRLVYCNVIICNNGFFGDSLVFSPYEKEYERIIYRHQGQQLFTTQVLKLPVKSLDMAQAKLNGSTQKFKSPPPGYIKKG